MENMPSIGWLNKKRLIVITVVLIILLVVYAHSYVPIHELSVVSDDQAKAHRSGLGGSYEFVESNCRWVVKWVREKPSKSSPHTGYFWTWIYKVSENTTLLSSGTSILVSGISARYGTNNSQIFHWLENSIIYGIDRADIRTDLFFDENGTYDVTLSLELKFYKRTPIGILPTGAHTIPMNGTFYVSIG
jgi:hypothetical protein